MTEIAATVFDAVGGEEFFVQLVDRFYDSVAGDADFLRFYPEPNDLSGARWRLSNFLVQYWGGPTTYSDERGHPRLRMRHNPYVINEAAKDRWMHHMMGAVETADCADNIKAQLTEYFERAAEHMINAQPPSSRDLTWRLTE